MCVYAFYYSLFTVYLSVTSVHTTVEIAYRKSVWSRFETEHSQSVNIFRHEINLDMTSVLKVAHIAQISGSLWYQ